MTAQQPPIRVAVVSFLFNWPSTGGGIVHTVELADFLGRAGYTVRHIYARNLAWGIGRVTQAVPFDSLPLDFNESNFQAETIQARFREAVADFDPDYVIVTDSWNFKPLLAEAVRDYPYFLRLQASECLCPLNNLRFLPTGEQCGNHQLADAQKCQACVERWSANSGGLHQAERALVGFGTARYNETLRRAFAEAEAVLVVNELAAAMVGPYARAVRVVTSGFDPDRFPWGEHDLPPDKSDGSKLQILMAGLVEDRIKGFHVLDAACQQLWRKRQDFELLVTGDPPGRVNDYTRNVGWLTQQALPAQMRAADIVVVPTVAQDALGRTAVEAMAASRPVVASRIGGLPFTIADGAGLLFEPGDADDLAQKLELLLDDGPLRRTIESLGRRRFDQHFTWQAIIDKHYRPLLANRRMRSTLTRSVSEAPILTRSVSEAPILTRRVSEAPILTRTVSEAPIVTRRVSEARSICAPPGAAPHRNGPTPRQRPRVALIYDDEHRPEITGVYCRRALDGLAEVEFFRPSQLASLPRGGVGNGLRAVPFDLFLNIDDGLRYRLPDHLRPSAWWCIDTHIDFAWSLEKARDFDLVYAAQRDGAERLRANGIATVQWLPLACDPEIHGRAEDGLPRPSKNGNEDGGQTHAEREDYGTLRKQYDICFVGNLISGRRTDLLRLIQQHFENVFVGRAYFDDMARIFASSKIVFNCSVANDINMRVFEALASGSLLLTNDLSENGLSDLFCEGVHLATYRDGHELIDKLRYYLNREDVRERIAAAGRAEALAKHTYRLRMEEVLDRAQGIKSEKHIGRREQANAALTALTHTITKRKMETPGAPVSSYYDFARPELLALVPQSAKNILEIGCGAGRLGESIKARQHCHITGVELNKDAAEQARQRLDQVITGDVESLDFASGFDCIICGDVLEHLRQPDRLLKRIHEWLAPGGALVASIPNVAHRSVIANLLRGDWEYEPAGLLDATHLRFFARRSIERALYHARFDLCALQAVPGPGDAEWWRSEKHAEAQIGPLHAQGLDRRQAEALHTYQYLLTAKAAPVPDYGLTTIVILAHNEWPYTERCLESIRFRTDEPYELIVVDNGSTDGTRERLQAMPDVKLIANNENRGFPAGVNQGIAAAKGAQVLLLNNDVIVTTGWLRRMLEAMNTSVVRGQLFAASGAGQLITDNPKPIGLVGLLTNAASGHQQIDVSYTDLDQLDVFAWAHGQMHAGKVAEVDRLVGFCLLIRRQVIDEIGIFDERFGVGNFEDDDYCRRALAAGWRLAVAQDAFIHHFGHRSFAAAGVDLNALLEKNKRIYDEKWKASVASGQWSVATGNGQLTTDTTANPKSKIENPKPLHPSSLIPLSLAMIVRDNERTIRAALESIKPWVDEMIVVDTGSTDATPDICRELGAEVYHFPWPDSFSIARNESLKYARGEWIFWMDSDDVVDAANGRKLRQLVAELVRVRAGGRGAREDVTEDGLPSPSPEQRDDLGRPCSQVLGFVMQVHCPGPGDAAHNLTVVDHVKLFRNLPELRFEGRIHEQVLPNIRRLNGEVEFTDIFVVHAGADHSPETRRRKLARDLHLLKLELREQPDHPFTLFNLGMTYADAGRHRRAIGFLRKSLATSDSAQSQVRKAYALLAGSCLQLGKLRAARRACRGGLQHFANDPELLFRAGLVAHRLGKLDEAEKCYLAALANRDERHFSSIDRGVVGFKARQNLATVYSDARELRKAEDEWRKIVAEVPGYRDGWIGLVENLLEQSRLADAAEIAARLAALCGVGVSPAREKAGVSPASEKAGETPAPQGLIIACLIVRAKLAEAHHDRRAALAALRQALAIAPDDVLARDMLCRLLFTAGDTAAAAVELARLVELDAANPSAQHNLGIARLQIGDFAGAARSLETSLRLRPTYDPTRRALAHARQMLGSFDHQNGRRALQEDGPPGPSPRMVTAWAGHPTPMPDREAKP